MKLLLCLLIGTLLAFNALAQTPGVVVHETTDYMMLKSADLDAFSAKVADVLDWTGVPVADRFYPLGPMLVMYLAEEASPLLQTPYYMQQFTGFRDQSSVSAVLTIDLTSP